jgi:peptidoglycan/LPS O-acetylase OafA/YrhL
MGAFRLGRVPALDGLRGVAVLAVIVFHAHPALLTGGFFGVDVFFTLSGFLITSLAVQEVAGTGRLSLRRFYQRRALRLLPALVTLLAVVVAAYALLRPEDLRTILIEAGIALAYAGNWTRAILVTVPDMLGHTWSLAVEEQFYLLWPPLFLLLMRVGGRRAALIGTIALAAGAWAWRATLAMTGASTHRIYNGLDTRLDALMIGCALALALSLLTSEQLERLRDRTRLITPLAMVTLAAFAAKSVWWAQDAFVWRYGTVAVLTAAVILGVTLDARSPLAVLLSMRWLRGVGVISYGLYLWHYPVSRFAAQATRDAWVVLVVTLVGSFVVAGISYFVVERPFLALKNRLRSGDVLGRDRAEEASVEVVRAQILPTQVGRDAVHAVRGDQPALAAVDRDA